jgi:riboflavin biosynthesis pyrimidine reductase
VKLILPEVRDLEPEDLYDLYDVPGPHLRAGFVASLDGAITVDGRSRGLQSPADLAVFRALRSVCDAVVVGAGTLRGEDYGPVRLQPSAISWRAYRDRSPEIPVVVVTRTGDLGSGRVLEGPTLVTGRDLPTELPEMVTALHERGLTRLLCEGGPSLLTDLLAHELVDELALTSAHLLVGTGPRLVDELPTPVSLELTHLVHDEPGVLLGRWSVVPSSGD